MKIRLAIIGCGAISELFHIPQALKTKDIELTVLIDKNYERVKTIANHYSIKFYGTNIKDFFQAFDAAIVATPNFTHSSIAIELLNSGKHCLVEKPLALSIFEGAKMVEISKKRNLVLGVGHIRRFYPHNIFIKNVIRSNIFGKIKSIEIEEGSVFSWPMASNSFLSKKYIGGGVLVDIGVHLLDLLFWWLEDVQLINYYDDARDGLEADSIVRLKSDECNIKMILSRQRNLKNNISFVFQNATLIINTFLAPTSKIVFNTNEKMDIDCLVNNKKENFIFEDLIKSQLQNFIDTILGKQTLMSSPNSALKSVEIIKECYENREKINYQWENYCEKN